jgi:hypothetical protein
MTTGWIKRFLLMLVIAHLVSTTVILLATYLLSRFPGGVYSAIGVGIIGAMVAVINDLRLESKGKWD